MLNLQVFRKFNAENLRDVMWWCPLSLVDTFFAAFYLYMFFEQMFVHEWVFRPPVKTGSKLFSCFIISYLFMLLTI